MFEVAARDPIQNRMTWYNKTINTSGGGRWHLHIPELPKDSECSFGTRTFDPSIAVSKSVKWVKENAFNYETLLVKNVVIHKMGMGWEECVYIVEIHNEVPRIRIEVGVSLNGEILYTPTKK